MPRVKTFDQQEVLEKAMELFWKKGFHATSIQELVDHLKVNRASLYDTFGGKKQLFNEAFSFYRKTNRARIIRFLNDQPTVKKGLFKLFEIAVDQALSDKDHKGCFVVNATTELATEDQQICDTLSDNKKQFEQIFYDYLSKGVEKGELNSGKDLHAIASLLFTFYNGLMVVAKVEPDREKLLLSIKAGLAVLD